MRKSKDWIFVIVQFLLFTAYLFEINFLNLEFPEWFRVTCFPFMVLGLVLILLSFFQLGNSLSPFPSPLKRASLITSGVYKYVRHPIYSGILVLLFSIALYKASEYKFLISIFLLILFHFKTIYEESKLLSKFPKYKEYRQVTGKFFPKFIENEK